MLVKSYSGMGSSISLGQETTYGVAVAPTQLIRFVSCDANMDVKPIESKEKSGSRAEPTTQNGSKIGNLKLSLELNKADIQPFLYGVMGAKSAVSGSGPYTRTYTMTNVNVLPSFTVRLIRGGFEGMLLTGVVFGKLSFKWAKDSYVTVDIEAVYQDEADVSLTSTAVVASTGTVTVTNTLVDGQPVKVFAPVGQTLPDFLSEDVVYYAKTPVGANTKLAASAGGAALVGSVNGSGIIRLLPLETLARSTDNRIGSNDCLITINALPADAVTSFSLDINNNLISDLTTVNSLGKIVGIKAGRFQLTGSFEAILNSDTLAYKTIRDANTLIPFQVKMNDGGSNYLQGAGTKIDLDGGAVKDDETTVTVSYTFKATVDTVTPWTWTLVNGSAS